MTMSVHISKETLSERYMTTILRANAVKAGMFIKVDHMWHKVFAVIHGGVTAGPYDKIRIWYEIDDHVSVILASKTTEFAISHSIHQSAELE